MSTHALPTGTVNFPVNLPVALRLAAGRFAYQVANMSLGRWVRGLISREVCGFTAGLRRGSAQVAELNHEGRSLFDRIAADGRITPDEAEAYRAYLSREATVDAAMRAPFTASPVDASAALHAEARAEMERMSEGNAHLGSMGAVAKEVAA